MTYWGKVVGESVDGRYSLCYVFMQACSLKTKFYYLIHHQVWTMEQSLNSKKRLHDKIKQ